MKRSIICVGVALAAMPFAAHAQQGQPYTPTVMPPPPPTTANAANYGPFPVGAWVPAGRNCRSDVLRLRKDRSYQHGGEAGTWRLEGPNIRFSYRVVPPNATNDMERSAPIRSRVNAMKMTADGKMTLNGGAWTRCSRDPDAPSTGGY